MEYHWYEDYWVMPRNLPRGHEFFIGYYQTQRAIHHHVAFIHTDQSCFLSTHLFDQGYRIFLHFKSGTVTDITPADANLGGRKTATTAFELVATGKGTITVTPDYNSLLYKVTVK